MNNQITGKRIKELRQYHSLTQIQLAEKLKTSQSLLHRWETGKRFVSVQTLLKLAKVFNVSIDNLVFSDKELKTLKSKDKNLISKINNFDNLSEKDKETVANLIDSLSKK